MTPALLSSAVARSRTVNGVQHNLAAGAGDIIFDHNADITLKIDSTVMPLNYIDHFNVGDVIDLTGISSLSALQFFGGAFNQLTFNISGGPRTLYFSPNYDLSGLAFHQQSDGHGGTEIFAVADTGNHAPTAVALTTPRSRR